MKIREIMTVDPIAIDASAPVTKAAQAMKAHDIGDVIVLKNGKVCGIVTDRDVAIRAVCEGKDPDTTPVEDICSRQILTVSPEETTFEAVQLMREFAVRRLPVVEANELLGIVSLGDLALALDRTSALGDISAAIPNR